MPLFNESLEPTLARCLTPRTSSTQFKRYPICKLDSFLEELKVDNKSTIRYLIDTEQQLWLAREGTPGGRVPPHGQMTGSNHTGVACIAAGNITFSLADKKIIMINNKSGDFQPGFDSVKWLFAILIANCAPDIFAKDIEFEFLPKSSSAITDRFTLGSEVVIRKIKSIFGPETIDELKVQPLESEELIFNHGTSEITPKKRARTDEAAPKSRRSIFFSDSSATSTSYLPVPFRAESPPSP